ncbi:hypothetical protein [Cetobacterium sp.]|uniref:hypothetical protein n=1 Tax=Cetobacterium sp. TaxID=2071632 RepID=UPI003F31076B
MKGLFFFVFFILHSILAISATNTSVDISTKLTLINPTRISIKELSNNDEINFKLDNLKEESVKVYIKEFGDDTKLYNSKNINVKLALNLNQSGLSKKRTVRVMYN